MKLEVFCLGVGQIRTLIPDADFMMSSTIVRRKVNTFISSIFTCSDMFFPACSKNTLVKAD